MFSVITWGWAEHSLPLVRLHSPNDPYFPSALVEKNRKYQWRSLIEIINRSCFSLHVDNQCIKSWSLWLLPWVSECHLSLGTDNSAKINICIILPPWLSFKNCFKLLWVILFLRTFQALKSLYGISIFINPRKQHWNSYPVKNICLKHL